VKTIRQTRTRGCGTGKQGGRNRGAHAKHTQKRAISTTQTLRLETMTTQTKLSWQKPDRIKCFFCQIICF